MKIKLAHLFPEKMNIYGDWGNIEALKTRITARQIEWEYTKVNSSRDLEHFSTSDMFFFGGGQDSDQMDVWKEINKSTEEFKSSILSAVNSNKVFLLICGGYQMFGNFFIDANGNKIPGLEILDIETTTPGPSVVSRCIGNIIIETHLPLNPKTLVGFENHGGQTYLTNSNIEQKPLGKVINGFGNNLMDKTEGCVYKNVFGSYMHGSLLPKNPHFADYLIALVLRNKYSFEEKLQPLDDQLEIKAHKKILERCLV